MAYGIKSKNKKVKSLMVVSGGNTKEFDMMRMMRTLYNKPKSHGSQYTEKEMEKFGFVKKGSLYEKEKPKDKAHVVSGVKYGKQKAWAFKSQKEAEDYYNKVKFQRGWRDLGIAEHKSYAEAKKIADFSHNSYPA